MSKSVTVAISEPIAEVSTETAAASEATTGAPRVAPGMAPAESVAIAIIARTRTAHVEFSAVAELGLAWLVEAESGRPSAAAGAAGSSTAEGEPLVVLGGRSGAAEGWSVTTRRFLAGAELPESHADCFALLEAWASAMAEGLADRMQVLALT